MTGFIWIFLIDLFPQPIPQLMSPARLYRPSLSCRTKITLKNLTTEMGSCIVQFSVSCPIISKTTLLKKKLSHAHPNNQRTATVAVARVSASLTGAEELAVRDVLLLTRRPDQQEVDLDKVQGLMKMVNIPVHSFTLLVGQYGHLEKCKKLFAKLVKFKLTSIGCQIG